MKLFLTCIPLSVFCSLGAVFLFMRCIMPEQENSGPRIVAEKKFQKQQAEVKKLLLADVEKYGLDIYRIYEEFSHATQAAPGMDFGVEKSLKKLQVTYPESNAYKLAEACSVFFAISTRDIIRIDEYLRKLKNSESVQMLPSGYEIEPQLRIAKYNYFFHIGKYKEARRELEYLLEKFPDSLICQQQNNLLTVEMFVREQLEFLSRGLPRKEK